MRRVFLLFVIIGMCIFVAIGGTFTFLESNSVLKQKKSHEVLEPSENISLLIDKYTGKIYILYENRIVKSCTIKNIKANSSLPEGNYIISERYILNNSIYILINTSLGQYAIVDENHPFIINNRSIAGSIKISKDDIFNIYKDVRYGTQVRIIGYNKKI